MGSYDEHSFAIILQTITRQGTITIGDGMIKFFFILEVFNLFVDLILGIIFLFIAFFYAFNGDWKNAGIFYVLYLLLSIAHDTQKIKTEIMDINKRHEH